jgi:hypothetical protein
MNSGLAVANPALVAQRGRLKSPIPPVRIRVAVHRCAVRISSNAVSFSPLPRPWSAARPRLGAIIAASRAVAKAPEDGCFSCRWPPPRWVWQRHPGRGRRRFRRTCSVVASSWRAASARVSPRIPTPGGRMCSTTASACGGSSHTDAHLIPRLGSGYVIREPVEGLAPRHRGIRRRSAEPRRSGPSRPLRDLPDHALWRHSDGLQ